MVRQGPQDEGRPAGAVRPLGGDDGPSQSSGAAAVVICVFNDWARARWADKTVMGLVVSGSLMRSCPPGSTPRLADLEPADRSLGGQRRLVRQFLAAVLRILGVRSTLPNQYPFPHRKHVPHGVLRRVLWNRFWDGHMTRNLPVFPAGEGRRLGVVPFLRTWDTHSVEGAAR